MGLLLRNCWNLNPEFEPCWKRHPLVNLSANLPMMNPHEEAVDEYCTGQPFLSLGLVSFILWRISWIHPLSPRIGHSLLCAQVRFYAQVSGCLWLLKFYFWPCHAACGIFLNDYFIYLFLAALRLSCCVQAFSRCGKWRLHSSCGVWASHPRIFSYCTAWAPGSVTFRSCGMWDLPGPGTKPVSSAWAGRFLTTGPPGNSLILFWFQCKCLFVCLPAYHLPLLAQVLENRNGTPFVCVPSALTILPGKMLFVKWHRRLIL